MKKFFTLIACALVAGSAFAQNEYKDPVELVKNGTIKYVPAIKTDLSKYPPAQLTSFVSKEWVTGEQVQGTPRVVVDPIDAANWANDEDGRNLLNYCIEVVSRDAPKDPVLDDEGNPVLDDDGNPTYTVQNIDAWDSRFFVVLPEPLHEGDIVTFSMDIKAEKDASGISTQGHSEPDAYVTWGILGNINFTTSWETFTSEFTVGAYDNGEVGAFAFDLGATKEANKFYFDNISVVVKRIVQEEKTWTNIMINGDLTGNDMRCFYSKEYPNPDPYWSEVVDGVIAVNSAAKVSEDWDSQFWIRLPQVLPAGAKFNISFDYKASDAASNVATQCHEEPGNYIHYSCIGNFNFTTEWQTFEKTVTVPSQCDGSQNNSGYLNNFHSIAFNLTKSTDIVYYFKNFKLEIDVNDLAENDFPEGDFSKDVVTGITSAKAAKAAKTIYNVAGQQLKSLQKGLNIVNGEKVYVK